MGEEVNKKRALIEQALSLHATARTQFLAQIEDETLQLEIETLLGDEVQLTQFLHTTADHAAPQEVHEVADLAPGTKINRITIDQLLGQGGMGAVYLGFDEKLQREVAVKSIKAEHLKNPATQQRFVREAQILSKINHPSICHIYDYLETETGDYLVLEYIRGKQLFQVGLTPEQTLDVLIELAKALAVAHRHGVVHRDLKPDNIMITDEHKLKVLDFGIAQSITGAAPAADDAQSEPNHTGAFELTQQGALIGTIRYMSPEQAKGEPIDTPSDLYSFGIIAQELLSKQPAYPVLSTRQLLADVQQGKRVTELALQPAYLQLLTDLTQHVPDDRPSAPEVVERLQAIKQAPAKSKQRRLKGLVAIVAVLLLVLAAWQWQQKSQFQDNTKRVNEYTNSINELVKSSEQIYVLPIHDVRDEIDRLLQQAAVLYGQIEADEGLTESSRKTLQGLIFLEAEEFAMAVEHLSAGDASSQLLARAWIGLYIEKIMAYSELHGVVNAMQSTTIKNQYLLPTLTYIEQAEKESGTPNALYQAFVVSQTDSLENALVMVDELLQAQKWNKQAVKLKALILSAMSVRAREAGDWALARDYSVLTVQTYQRSTEMARSYPYDYYSLCETAFALMVDGLQRTGAEVDKYGALAIQAGENYLQTRPGEPAAMNLLARVHMIMAQWQLNTGQDANQSLQLAQQWLDQSMAVEQTILTLWGQGLIHATRAKQQIMAGHDAMAAIDLALTTLAQAAEQVQENQAYLVSDQLYVMALLANEQHRLGLNFQVTIEQAEAMYQKVSLDQAMLATEKKGLLVNMAEVYFVDFLARFEQQQDLMASGQQLLAFLSQPENQLENEPNQLTRLATVHGLMAVQLHQQNKPLGQHLVLAENHIKQARSINPNHFGVLSSQAFIMTLSQLRGDQDFTAVNQLFAAALAANPELPHTYHVWARSYLLQAQADLSHAEKLSVVKSGLQKIAQARFYDEHNQSFQLTQQALMAMAEPMMP